MRDCTEACIKYMKAFLEEIGHRKRGLVLDACCGDGRVTRDLLAKIYDTVDCFDQDPQAIMEVQKNTFALSNVRHIDCSSM